MSKLRKSSSSNRGSATCLSSTQSLVRVTKQEFNGFCEGDDDPMLKFLAMQADEAEEAGTSQSAKQEEVIYQNTFRTEPSYEFLPDKVSDIIQATFTEKLKGLEYEPNTCQHLACDLSELIKEMVKKRMNLPRHKLVSFVVIGERCDQGAIMGSRCIWNVKFDGYASSSYTSDSLFAVGVLYAVFLE